MAIQYVDAHSTPNPLADVAEAACYTAAVDADGGIVLQDGWQRRRPFVVLDADTAARLLAPIFGRAALRSLKPLSGGLANSNYRVEVDGRRAPVVLRIYTRDPAACGREEALYRLVRTRVPVPDVLFADASCTRFEHPYAVQSWIDGVPLTAGIAEDPFGAGRAVGTTLVAIGAHRFAEPGEFSAGLSVAGSVEPAPEAQAASVNAGGGNDAGRTFLGHIEYCLRHGAADRLGEPLAATVGQFVHRHAGYLPATVKPAALVHGDYKAGNILLSKVQGRWQVAGVLDWEFAFAGPALFDLAILLRYVERLPPAFLDGVVTGYRNAGGVLPPEWQRTIRLLDFVNLFDFLTAPDASAELVADVQRLVRRTMVWWTAGERV